MTRIEKTNKFEKAVIQFLNLFDDWQLEWVGDQNLCYDAKGYTPKGNKCVVEMKFRTKYYETKMLEKKKYDNLMDLPQDVVKIYFVSDPKGTYWFWLDKLTQLKKIDQNCPSTSYWNNKKISKEVYMLEEKHASVIDRPSKPRENVWADYFKKKDCN